MEKFCAQCGEKLPEGAGFCKKCGAAVPVPENVSAAGETEKAQGKIEKSGGKGKAVAVAAAAAVILAAGIVIFLNSDGHQCRKNLKLAEEAYGAEDYEEALFYYEEALYFDDTIADAYLKPAEIYLAEKEYEKAEELLSEGLNKTGDSSLQGCLAAMYVGKSNQCLENGECLEAVEILAEGMEKYDLEELSERDAYLREHIVIVKAIQKVYQDDKHLYDKESEYDRAGNILKETVIYDPDYEYKVSDIDEYEYDAQGNMVKLTIYDDNDAESMWWYEYEYDAQGNRLKETAYLNAQIVNYSRWEQEYDGQGNRIRENGYYWTSTYFDGETLLYYDDYEYDAQGNLTKDSWFDGNGELRAYYEYEYDGQGNVTKDASYSADGKLYSCYGYEYDTQGNITKYVKYKADDVQIAERKWENSYDILGNILDCCTLDRDNDSTPENWQYEYEYAYIGEL